MRARNRLILLIVLLVGAVAHLGWWYAPRVHRATPSQRGTELLHVAGPDAIWIAYPHQNLGAADDKVPIDSLWHAVCRLAGDGECAPLPRFGPVSFPPAREIVASRDGRLVALHAYPTVRWLARAAGRLANNPWLEGGEVESEGRVAWLHGWWLYAPAGSLPSAADLSPADPAPKLDSALAWAQLGHPWFGLAPALVQVDLDSNGLFVGEHAPASGPVACGAEVVLQLRRIPSWLTHGLVLAESGESGAGGGDLGSIKWDGTIPRVALLGEAAEVDRIADLLRPVISRWVEVDRPGYHRAVASDREALALLSGGGGTSACLDAARLDRDVGSGLRTVADLPLLSRSERRRLGAMADLMRLLAPLGRIEWVVAEDGRSARLRADQR